MIFPLESIPIIYNEDYGYIIKFDDLEYINEYYGLDYTNGIHCLLEENKIDNYVVAIDHWKIINNPIIINELGNIIIIPQSKNSFAYRYVDYLLELGKYAEDYKLFLDEAFDQHLYYEDFLLHEGIIGSRVQDIRRTTGNIVQGAINGLQNYGNNIKNTVGTVTTGIKTDYNNELNNITNGNNPTLGGRITAGTNLVKNAAGIIGQGVKTQISNGINNVKQEYQGEIDRAQQMSGTIGNKAKAQAISHVIRNRVKKGAANVLDVVGSIPDPNGSALDMMSDVFIPSPEFKIPAMMLRHSREIGIARQIAKARSSQIIASLERQLEERKNRLSRTFGNAKIELQREISDLGNKIRDLRNHNGGMPQ